MFFRILLVSLWCGVTLLAQPAKRGSAIPTTWRSVGVGGGGSLFSPSFSPHNPNELYVACDMSELFHSTDLGLTWDPVPFGEMVGNRPSDVAFTSDPNLLFCLDQRNDLSTPARSLDGGVTWSQLGADPTGGEAYTLQADVTRTDRLFVSDYSNLYFSRNGGTSFPTVFTTGDGAGLHIGGSFFDGETIYVGTNQGVLLSTNGGQTFAVAGYTGIPADQAIVSFAAAREASQVRMFCVTLARGDVYAGVAGDDHWGYASVYRLDVGSTVWSPVTTGIIAGDHPFFVRMARSEIDTAYLAGGSDDGVPIVYRTTNGGTNWTQTLVTNGNIATGWCGHQGDRGWGYAEITFGFDVADNDPNTLAFADYGFIHLSTDGGSTWRQAYVDPATANPAGSPTPTQGYYGGIGMENTSVWWLTWSSANDIFASFTDIRGIRSQDGGETWGFDYTGHSQNTMYHAERNPLNGFLYAATSTVHDLYQTTYLTDARIDGGDGGILVSQNNGATWTTLNDFNHPVIWITYDPNQTNLLYAAVVHSTAGDIYRFDLNNQGAGWTRLATPPRTEGHPFNIKVLNDGTLVATYCGRRNSGGTFTASSGVFVSTNGGSSWLDRSDSNMVYYTKDLTIDPHDATQNTWYASVWSGWGGPPNGTGGLYRSTNRGQNWTRIWNSDRVSSCTIDPNNPNLAYVTTETEGLWVSENLTLGSPTFSQVESYPFRQPERVFFNPYDANEIWVSSFGNGIRIGTVGPSECLNQAFWNAVASWPNTDVLTLSNMVDCN
ncbi:MAG: hypothetical protein KDC71_22525 [Acidobacteria bacterium]|nr:hypothetical protein [Acidobacteriota bacterium]